MTFSNSSTSRTNIFVSSAMLDCSITTLCHVTKSTGATYFVLQENLKRCRGRRRCIKECSRAVAQATGALLNATRLWRRDHSSPPPLGPVAFQCSAICRGAQTVVNEQFGWLWLYRSAEVDGNIVSRAMYKVVAYVDHWFTNLCAWMLVYNDSSISVQTCRLADLYHLLATCTHISDFSDPP